MLEQLKGINPVIYLTIYVALAGGLRRSAKNFISKQKRRSISRTISRHQYKLDFAVPPATLLGFSVRTGSACTGSFGTVFTLGGSPMSIFPLNLAPSSITIRAQKILPSTLAPLTSVTVPSLRMSPTSCPSITTEVVLRLLLGRWHAYVVLRQVLGSDCFRLGLGTPTPFDLPSQSGLRGVGETRPVS